MVVGTFKAWERGRLVSIEAGTGEPEAVPSSFMRVLPDFFGGGMVDESGARSRGEAFSDQRWRLYLVL